MARGLPVGEDLKEGNSLRIRGGSGVAEYRTVRLVFYFVGNLISHGAYNLEPRTKLIDVHYQSCAGSRDEGWLPGLEVRKKFEVGYRGRRSA